MSPKIIEYPSREALSEGVAGLVARRLRTLVDERGIARIAVPGGTTPGAMLERLGRERLDWEKVVVTLTDERWVPTTEPRSNQKLLAETLFAGPAAAATFSPLYGGTAEPAGSLPAVAAGLEQTALPLDIAVLGMGADMHTASLFPGSVGLHEALAEDAPVVVAIRTGDQPEPRVTLSARVLRGAGERHILITGTAKREALQRALAATDPLQAPIRAVLEGATVHFAE
ncbi:6-phosphogluconolactonase [Breoghania corrubedonensis]|uniref:6-phosphogluconolactonase n=1 Tax=Breoghania corrubedonensis TaxID=665038 RepID=A0A2T5VGX4_9HYPH|nr:6-phosphogluconolactonase [Breoghania corrubedonensis]PTW62999.1 6-phosphogluconolactonase [Breoghania corrubedonensis]